MMLTLPVVIASAAKQSSCTAVLDCFAALAMTIWVLINAAWYKMLGLMIAVLVQSATSTASPHGDQYIGPPSVTCVAEPVQRLIGRVASPRIVARAKRLAKATSVRILRADGVMTMDYGYGRLNIITNDRNIITALRCG
jgi:Peptidase inhibitor I78 family